MSQRPAGPAIAVYEFTSVDEMLRGWQVHAARQRLIHDESSRYLTRWHYAMGVPAVALTAVVGTTAVAGWPVVAGILAAAASVLVGVQTFLNHGARAETHRLTAMAYKRMIRRLERLPPLNLELSALAVGADGQAGEIRELEQELAETDAAAPSPIPRIVDKYNAYGFDFRSAVPSGEPAPPTPPVTAG